VSKNKTIKTTSTMRSRLKDLETKERVKTLIKRSMNEKELRNVQKNIDLLFQDQECFGFSDPRKIGDQNPYRNIQNKLNRLNLLNLDIVKLKEDDIISYKSNKSFKTVDDNRSKISTRNSIIKKI